MKYSPKARRFLKILLIFSLIVLALRGSTEYYRNLDYQSHFIKLKGHLVSIQETPIENESSHSLLHIHLQNSNEIKVQGQIRIPRRDAGPYPAVVMLGGLRTGKNILDYIETTDDLVLLALDYPYEGKKYKLSWWEFLKNAPRIRKSIINTVPSVMLSIDYLLGRSDIDPDMIILIGGSVGALFAPSIAASDPRIKAVAILFGAGDLQSLLNANIELPFPAAAIASWAGSILASPVEPLKYIDRISPRPVFMLNGTDDPRMPVRCSQLLHEKAGHPKTIRWISCGHLHVRSEEFHRLVHHELISWLEQNHFISFDSTRNEPNTPIF